MFRHVAVLACLLISGCAAVLPDVSHQPTLHNPFPQITKIAVAPFFNLSLEPTLDGRKVANAYASELQQVPGFEVISVGVVEQKMVSHQLELRNGTDARRLAQLLDVDAVVLGAVTDYSPYYPPRMTIHVGWYAANPYFHPVPPGYGLPWGRTGERDIPGPLVFESELALAKAQLKTQTPPYEKIVEEAPPPAGMRSQRGKTPESPKATASGERQASATTLAGADGKVRQASHQVPEVAGSVIVPSGRPCNNGNPNLPADWPDPRGFIPPPPSARPRGGVPSTAPVLQHVRAYNGHDSEFTTALANYYHFRDDERRGGWQDYLHRSDDFVRFCCHMHIWEMLSARGGAGETRVVWRWSEIR